jgi:hypothetical protein
LESFATIDARLPICVTRPGLAPGDLVLRRPRALAAA